MARKKGKNRNKNANKSSPTKCSGTNVAGAENVGEAKIAGNNSSISKDQMDLRAQNRERILNYCRMHKLRERGTRILLVVFRTRWSLCHSAEWTDGDKCGEALFQMCQESKTVLQGKEMKEKIRAGKSTIWDITLLWAAIRAVTHCIQSSKCGHFQNYEEEDRYIATIRDVRNEICHIQNSELSDDQFDKLWQKMTKALINVGSSYGGLEASELDKIKSMDLADNNAASNDPHNSKAAQLKIKANKEFVEGKNDAAIESYSQILNIPGLSSEFQATIYSNRSAAFLQQNTDSSRSLAKGDAKLAIQLRPSLWRAYYRLGCVYLAYNKTEKALIQLGTALALNPGEKSVTSKIYQVRQESGFQSREQHNAPQPELASEEEQMKKIQQMFGLSPKQMDTVMKMTESTPYSSNVLKAHRYRDGSGVQQNFQLAAKHYAEAARLGNPEGMYNLALLHDKGLGVKQDYATSIFWLRKAAESKGDARTAHISGIAHSQHSLGLKYSEGVGVKQDFRESARWYEKAVKNKYGPSANNLGLLYKNGTGVERSLEKAFVHFQMASDLDDTPGMMNLAHCYLMAEGTGSMPDKEKALHWLRRAAALGDLSAVREVQMLEDAIDKHGDLSLHFEALTRPAVPKDVGFKDSLTDEHIQFVPAVRLAAHRGSTVAKEVLIIWSCMEDAMEAFKRGHNAKMMAQLAKAIRMDFQLIKIPDLLKAVVEREIEVDQNLKWIVPNDLDTIVCHIGMSNKDRRLPKFIDGCLRKFPDDLFLLEMHAVCLIAYGQIDEALKVAEMALKKYPNNVRLLYLRATAYSMEIEEEEEEAPYGQERSVVLRAWNDFLHFAPKDHPKVPAAHYRMAIASMSSDESSSKFIERFEEGLAAEKLQLPCFLPYDFPPKYQLEKTFNMLKLMNSKKEKNAAEWATSNCDEKVVNTLRREHAHWDETMNNDIRDQPGPCSRICALIGIQYQYYLDRLTPHISVRWTLAIALILCFVWRIVAVQGFYIVTYALFIYYLNLFLAFLTPKIDPAMEFDEDDDGPVLPKTTNEEFRPFMRRLPEFKFWLSTMRSTLIAFTCTFFEIFDVPVFWPILVMYFIILTCLTMKRQIMHMIRYRYIPFTTGKPRPAGKEDSGKIDSK